MNGKKYLSLEEAAQLLGTQPDQVIRLREKGELRGFADRGTWKFKADDVEECKRRRQPDSNPDVPLMTDDDDSALELDVGKGSASDSDVRLMMTDDVRKQLTGSSGEVPVMKASSAKSDSDVRLVGAPPKKESDSDVKLIVPKKGSDSDVKLSDSDSDVRLASGPKTGSKVTDSDSDVRLALPADSDSDVRLLDSSKKQGKGADSPLPMYQGMSDSALMDDEGPLALPADSGVRLTGDSAIQLHRPTDSGILLERPGDSGINLADDAPLSLLDSGVKTGRSSSKLGKQPPKTMAETDDMELGTPMLLRDEEGDRTDPEVPLLLDEEEEHDLMPKNFLGGSETDAETSVVMFDEDEEETVVPTRKRGKGLDADEAAFDLETGDATDEDADELEVSEEVLGEDDELEDLEVFESEDADFESGVSAAEFATVGSRMAVPVEQEWDTWSVVLPMVSAIVMVVGAWMAADLLHTVSAAGSPVAEGVFVSTFAGLFK